MAAAARRATLLALAVLSLSPAAAAASRLDSFELPSARVDTTTPGGTLADGRTVPKVNVLLPDGYDRHSNHRYPVTWLLHGAGGGTDNWIGDPRGLKKLLRGLPGIIVMPDGGRYGMYMNWWNGGIRGRPAWATYHLQVLRRAIERRYPIRAGRRWHAIAGISMGGQGALRYSALLPGYFGSAAGFSAAVPDMQSPEAQAGIALLPVAGGASGISYGAIFGPSTGPYAEGNSPQALAPNYGHTRLYLTSGNGINCPQDPINPASIAVDITVETAINKQQGPFAAAARAAGADVTEHTTCGVHTFGVWDRAIRDSITNWRFFKPVVRRARNWTYRTVARSGEVWGFRFRFGAAPDSVVRFERSRRVLSGAGDGTVSIRRAGGCRIEARLPFHMRLPHACLGGS